MTGISGWNTAMKGRDGFEQQKHQAGAGPVWCFYYAISPPKGLLLHLEIPDMAAGHDDHKVLVGDGQIVADAGKVPADHLLRRGEQPGVGQLRPVVEHHRAEADGGQQGAQGLGDMSRAEQQGPLADGQRQGDIPRRHGEARGPQGLGGILRQTAGNHALPVQQRRGGAVLRQHQPAGGAAVQ